MEKIQIFNEYQNKGLLPNLGGDDKIYDALQTAAESIATFLSENPSKITNYALVSFDNNILETEPVLLEVEKIISEKWKMMRSLFNKEMPITLYRAVVLQSLANLVEKNNNHAIKIWFAVSDTYQYLNIPHKEQAILNDFLYKVGDLAEEQATEEWTIEKEEIEVEIPDFNLKLIATTSTKINLEILTKSLTAASGPHGADGSPIPGANRYWSNQQQHWSYDFAPRAAKGIENAINTVLQEQNQNLGANTEKLQKALNEYFVKLGENLQTALDSSIQSSIAVERRSQLLWWKETLYSRKIHKSYRKLSKFQCAIAMAVDLYYLLPNTFPISVDFILREAFCSIHGHKDDFISLMDFMNQVNEEGQSEFLKKFLIQQSISDGRVDLVSFMQKVLYSKISITEVIENQLGIEPNKKISYVDIPVWILHCLSVQRLTKPTS